MRVAANLKEVVEKEEVVDINEQESDLRRQGKKPDRHG